MNENELGKKITRVLDDSIDKTIEPSTLYRLQAARRAALDNCQPDTKIFNTGSGTSAHGGHDSHLNLRKLMLLGTLLLALVAFTYWQFPREYDENAAIDIMMLADDLPIDAFVDNEFDEWFNSE